MRNPILQIITCSIILFLAGCQNTRILKAKAELEKEGIPLDKQAFFEKIKAEDLKTVGLMLDAGMDPNTIDEKFFTPLLCAVTNKSPEMLTLLLKNGADPNMQLNAKWDVHRDFFHSYGRGKPYLQWYKKVPRISTNKFGIAPLHIAAALQNKRMIKILLEHNADINIRDYRGATPLLFVKDLELVKFFVENGADVNIKSNFYKFPGGISLPQSRFTLAVASKDLKTVKYLIKSGAKPGEGLNWWCVGRNNIEILKYLLQTGCDPESIQNSMLGAATWSTVEEMKLLIKYGGDVNCKDAESLTPLILASQRGKKDIVEFLLKNKVDVNAVCDLKIYDNAIAPGGTALITAVQSNREKIVELLIKYGADVNIKTKNGWTALKMAKKELEEANESFNSADKEDKQNNPSKILKKCQHIVKLLETAGAKE